MNEDTHQTNPTGPCNGLGQGDACTPANQPTWSDASFTFMRGAMLSLVIAIIAGCIGVLYRFPPVGQALREFGVQFTVFRPLHTGFVMAWIFLGGVAIVHRYLEDSAPPMTQGDHRRVTLQKRIWVFAAISAFLTISAGITSGREYIGFHWAISIPILLGWLLFAWTFFKNNLRGFINKPVYVTMWGAGMLFFLYTFTEQHAYLIPEIFEHPITELRLQWKSIGTLVGSFNLFVYGTLIFVGEKISGDKTYAHSKMAYALFAVGLLNSFTNFAHHTYHVPQSHTVKWISFVISMTEIIILLRVVWDISKSVGKRSSGVTYIPTRCFLTAVKWWTAAMVGSAILLSIPQPNSIVHGTHTIIGHAMGTEIGIDTMALLAALTWLLEDRKRQNGGEPSIRRERVTRRWAIGLNVSAACLVLWLHFMGIVEGQAEYLGELTPPLVAKMSPLIFTTAGFATAICLIAILMRVKSELCGHGHPCLD